MMLWSDFQEKNCPGPNFPDFVHLFKKPVSKNPYSGPVEISARTRDYTSGPMPRPVNPERPAAPALAQRVAQNDNEAVHQAVSITHQS